MKILGISAFFHDAAAAILVDGNVMAACEEERFTRIKHDPSFPANAIKWCLSFCGFSMSELDAVVFYEKPFTKFGRLVCTYISAIPHGLPSYLESMPLWFNRKLFLKKTILYELERIEKIQGKKMTVLFSKHHLSHAASAFFSSSFEESAILTIDGVGEWTTASIAKGEGNSISITKQLDFPNSLGLLYSSFTDYCGFKVNSGEYKLMGLAPYGDRCSDIYTKCKEAISTELIDLKEDGSISMNQSYFRYAFGRNMVNDKKWERLFGFGRREPESRFKQPYCDMALAIQDVTEEIVIRMAKEAKRITGSDNLCMAGGVALNAVANGKLGQAKLYKDLFIQPASGDAGGAVGAALAAYHVYFNQPFQVKKKGSFNPLLGPETTSREAKAAVSGFHATYECCDDLDKMVKKTAGLLKEGFVIGWYQGRSEFGPRALGSRSILADPRIPGMQSKLNQKIKFREGFRPFAPSVLAEDAHEYFDMQYASPYMLLVNKIVSSRLTKLPDDFAKWKMEEKLHFIKSDIPAVTHVDGSARVQTVHQHIHPLFWSLLNHFKQLTGCSVLINTSFNVRNEPIVNSPEDAYRCFMRTGMDYLVIENLLFAKESQPFWTENQDWQHLHAPD